MLLKTMLFETRALPTTGATCDHFSVFDGFVSFNISTDDDPLPVDFTVELTAASWCERIVADIRPSLEEAEHFRANAIAKTTNVAVDDASVPVDGDIIEPFLEREVRRATMEDCSETEPDPLDDRVHLPTCPQLARSISPATLYLFVRLFADHESVHSTPADVRPIARDLGALMILSSASSRCCYPNAERRTVPSPYMRPQRSARFFCWTEARGVRELTTNCRRLPVEC